MAKNQSLPARLQEKDSQDEHDLTMSDHHENPTVWWLRPNLSNPRSTNHIVWAFLRENPSLLRVVTNCVLTYIYIYIYYDKYVYIMNRIFFFLYIILKLFFKNNKNV